MTYKERQKEYHTIFNNYISNVYAYWYITTGLLLQSLTLNQKLTIWSKCILLLYGHYCANCGARKRILTKIHAHHIKSKKEYPLLSYSLLNGIPLCASCHRKILTNKLPLPKKPRKTKKYLKLYLDNLLLYDLKYL